MATEVMRLAISVSVYLTKYRYHVNVCWGVYINLIKIKLRDNTVRHNIIIYLIMYYYECLANL